MLVMSNLEVVDYMLKAPARYHSQLDYRNHLSYPLLNALQELKTSIVISTIDDASHCLYSSNKREIELSAVQAYDLAGKMQISFDIALEAICLHELGHLMMSVVGYPQEENALTEQMAWLLGGAFINYTGVSKSVYNDLLTEML